MNKYYAVLNNEEVVYLGEFEEIGSAMDHEPPNAHWVFSEAGLRDLRDNINEVLGGSK